MTTNAHKTAISRRCESVPAREMLKTLATMAEAGHTVRRVLDHGCGRGYDTAWLAEQGYEVVGYDPHWAPEDPGAGYDAAMSCYVLNVVDEATRVEVVRDVAARLRDKGFALFAARSAREIKREAAKAGWSSRGDGFVTGSGTFQHGLDKAELRALVEAEGLNAVVAWRKGDTVFALGAKP